jgi:hypothetical protein
MRTLTRVFIYDKDGVDISNELETKNGKANPFGWSQSELWHKNNQIGWVECGAVDLFDGYTKKEAVEEIVEKLEDL